MEYGVERVETDFFDVNKFKIKNQLILIELRIILKLLQLAVDQVLTRIHLFDRLFPFDLGGRCVVPQELDRLADLVEGFVQAIDDVAHEILIQLGFLDNSADDVLLCHIVELDAHRDLVVQEHRSNLEINELVLRVLLREGLHRYVVVLCFFKVLLQFLLIRGLLSNVHLENPQMLWLLFELLELLFVPIKLQKWVIIRRGL